ncbi:hypothetical protein TWF694_010492 [Orbilia ellipsospora]|uniref:Methyltransferase domain-containing protein n=1 Tax=Orbilia ellipsospora TaxID=2528407 RepID=A0AAV9XBE3_9PEZI
MAMAVQSQPIQHQHSREYEKYELRFDDDAKLRLKQQNSVTRELLGGSFLPNNEIERLRSIAASGKRPRIADIGTGPGDWMFSVRAELRAANINAIIDGYDLFPAHFPSLEEQKAEDITFSQLNIHDKDTFPDLEEGYDLVHVRYLTICITREQWDGAFDNCISILKPEGTLMWEEIFFDRFKINDREKYQGATRIFDAGMELFLSHGMPINCGPKLTSLFKTHFKKLDQEEYSTSNLDEGWQRLQAKNMYMVTREMLLKSLEKGAAGLKEWRLGSMEEGRELARTSLTDYQNGCLTNMDLGRWIGTGLVV